jgi:hypothetical protein
MLELAILHRSLTSLVEKFYTTASIIGIAALYKGTELRNHYYRYCHYIIISSNHERNANFRTFGILVTAASSRNHQNGSGSGFLKSKSKSKS